MQKIGSDYENTDEYKDYMTWVSTGIVSKYERNPKYRAEVDREIREFSKEENLNEYKNL